jgi:O-methyltransferase involved in polyketide biosynthesis
MTDLDEPSSLPPSLRTAGDSWAITELVGATALGVAAGRAVETAGADPLIRANPRPILVSSAGQAWAWLADPDCPG